MGPSISVSPQVLDLGEIGFQSGKVASFVVENQGDLDLFIKNFPVKNPKTGQSLDKKAIRPHEKIQLNYFYKPDKIGPFESSLVIKTNDRDHPVVRIPVRGTAVNQPSPKKG